MKPTLTFTRDTKQLKKPVYLKNGVFLIYAPKKIEISPMQFKRNDTKITVILPKHHQGYFTSKFRSDEIESITGNQQRIWKGILNRSLTDNIVTKKNKPFGFFVLESTGDVNFKHETAKNNSQKNTSKISKKVAIGRFFKHI